MLSLFHNMGWLKKIKNIEISVVPLSAYPEEVWLFVYYCYRESWSIPELWYQIFQNLRTKLTGYKIQQTFSLLDNKDVITKCLDTIISKVWEASYTNPPSRIRLQEHVNSVSKNNSALSQQWILSNKIHPQSVSQLCRFLNLIKVNTKGLWRSKWENISPLFSCLNFFGFRK